VDLFIAERSYKVVIYILFICLNFACFQRQRIHFKGPGIKIPINKPIKNYAKESAENISLNKS
jgi:hypothetical protein